jgi:hypothetical protein
MHLVRRVSALAIGVALCGGLLVSSPAAGQQRAYPNPLQTKVTDDPDITSVKLDATTSRITTTFITENVGAGANLEMVLSSTRNLGDSSKRYVALGVAHLGTDEQTIAGFRLADDKSEEIPTKALQVRWDGNAISVSVDTAQAGHTGPFYVVAGLGTPSRVSYAAASYTDQGFEGLGPVATVPDPSRTSVSLSSARQVYGKGGVRASVRAKPAVPGRVELFDGATRIQSVSTRTGAVTLQVPASLRPGTHRLRVRFTPTDALHHAPSEATAGFTVVAPARRTVTRLKLSKSRQVRGKTPARATVVVSSAPAGTVTILDGTRKLRTVKVRQGRTSVVLPRTLKAGTHTIRAVFRPADLRAVLGSVSKSVRLRVVKR